MIDFIRKKIDEINQKPEHIRIKFFYGTVFVAMVFVIFVWIISTRVNFSKTSDNVEETTTTINDLIKDSIKK